MKSTSFKSALIFNETSEHFFRLDLPNPAKVLKKMIAQEDSYYILTDDGELWKIKAPAQKSADLDGSLMISSIGASMLKDFNRITVIEVAANDNVMLAVSNQGYVYSWGRDPRKYGLLGLGDVYSVDSPRRIFNTYQVQQVSISSKHAAAVDSNGDIYTWGSGPYGELCHPGITSLKQPMLFKSQKYLSCKSVICYKHVTGIVTTGGHLLLYGNIIQDKSMLDTKEKIEILEDNVPGKEGARTIMNMPNVFVLDLYFGTNFCVFLTKSRDIYVVSDYYICQKLDYASKFQTISVKNNRIYSITDDGKFLVEWEYRKNSSPTKQDNSKSFMSEINTEVVSVVHLFNEYQNDLHFQQFQETGQVTLLLESDTNLRPYLKDNDTNVNQKSFSSNHNQPTFKFQFLSGIGNKGKAKSPDVQLSKILETIHTSSMKKIRSPSNTSFISQDLSFEKSDTGIPSFVLSQGKSRVPSLTDTKGPTNTKASGFLKEKEDRKTSFNQSEAGEDRQDTFKGILEKKISLKVEKSINDRKVCIKGGLEDLEDQLSRTRESIFNRSGAGYTKTKTNFSAVSSPTNVLSSSFKSKESTYLVGTPTRNSKVSFPTNQGNFFIKDTQKLEKSRENSIITEDRFLSPNGSAKTFANTRKSSDKATSNSQKTFAFESVLPEPLRTPSKQGTSGSGIKNPAHAGLHRRSGSHQVQQSQLEFFANLKMKNQEEQQGRNNKPISTPDKKIAPLNKEDNRRNLYTKSKFLSVFNNSNSIAHNEKEAKINNYLDSRLQRLDSAENLCSDLHSTSSFRPTDFFGSSNFAVGEKKDNKSPVAYFLPNGNKNSPQSPYDNEQPSSQLIRKIKSQDCLDSFLGDKTPDSICLDSEHDLLRNEKGNSRYYYKEDGRSNFMSAASSAFPSEIIDHKERKDAQRYIVEKRPERSHSYLRQDSNKASESHNSNVSKNIIGNNTSYQATPLKLNQEQKYETLLTQKERTKNALSELIGQAKLLSANPKESNSVHLNEIQPRGPFLIQGDYQEGFLSNNKTFEDKSHTLYLNRGLSIEQGDFIEKYDEETSSQFFKPSETSALKGREKVRSWISSIGPEETIGESETLNKIFSLVDDTIPKTPNKGSTGQTLKYHKTSGPQTIDLDKWGAFLSFMGGEAGKSPGHRGSSKSTGKFMAREFISKDETSFSFPGKESIPENLEFLSPEDYKKWRKERQVLSLANMLWRKVDKTRYRCFVTLQLNGMRPSNEKSLILLKFLNVLKGIERGYKAYNREVSFDAIRKVKYRNLMKVVPKYAFRKLAGLVQIYTILDRELTLAKHGVVTLLKKIQEKYREKIERQEDFIIKSFDLVSTKNSSQMTQALTALKKFSQAKKKKQDQIRSLNQLFITVGGGNRRIKLARAFREIQSEAKLVQLVPRLASVLSKQLTSKAMDALRSNLEKKREQKKSLNQFFITIGGGNRRIELVKAFREIQHRAKLAQLIPPLFNTFGKQLTSEGIDALKSNLEEKKTQKKSLNQLFMTLGAGNGRIQLVEAFRGIQNKAKMVQLLLRLFSALSKELTSKGMSALKSYSQKKKEQKKSLNQLFITLGGGSRRIKLAKAFRGMQRKAKFAQLIPSLLNVLSKQLVSKGIDAVKLYSEKKEQYLNLVSEPDNFVQLSMEKVLMFIKRRTLCDIYDYSRTQVRKLPKSTQLSFALTMKSLYMKRLKSYFDSLRWKAIEQKAVKRQHLQDVFLKHLVGILQKKVNDNYKEGMEAMKIHKTMAKKREARQAKECEFKVMLLASKLNVMLKQRKTGAFYAIKQSQSLQNQMKNKRYVLLSLKSLIENMKKKTLKDALNEMFELLKNERKKRKELEDEESEKKKRKFQGKLDISDIHMTKPGDNTLSPSELELLGRNSSGALLHKKSRFHFKEDDSFGLKSPFSPEKREEDAELGFEQMLEAVKNHRKLYRCWSDILDDGYYLNLNDPEHIKLSPKRAKSLDLKNKDHEYVETYRTACFIDREKCRDILESLRQSLPTSVLNLRNIGSGQDSFSSSIRSDCVEKQPGQNATPTGKLDMAAIREMLSKRAFKNSQTMKITRQKSKYVDQRIFLHGQGPHHNRPDEVMEMFNFKVPQYSSHDTSVNSVDQSPNKLNLSGFLQNKVSKSMVLQSSNNLDKVERKNSIFHFEAKNRAYDRKLTNKSGELSKSVSEIDNPNQSFNGLPDKILSDSMDMSALRFTPTPTEVKGKDSLFKATAKGLEKSEVSPLSSDKQDLESITAGSKTLDEEFILLHQKSTASIHNALLNQKAVKGSTKAHLRGKALTINVIEPEESETNERPKTSKPIKQQSLKPDYKEKEKTVKPKKVEPVKEKEKPLMKSSTLKPSTAAVQKLSMKTVNKSTVQGKTTSTAQTKPTNKK